MPTAARLGLFYALMFSGAGVAMPFAALWFQSRGLSGAEIGVILAGPMLARIVAGPLIAVWADGFRLRREPLLLLGLLAVLAYGALQFGQGFAVLMVLWLTAATAYGATVPLTDVLTLRLSRREGFAFARARSVGSVAFIVGNVAMGAILTRAHVDAVVWWLIAAAAGSAIAARMILPAEPVFEGGGKVAAADRFRGLGRLVADPLFMTAILSVGAVQAAHAFYYAFSTLTWKAQGVPEALVGMLWGTGVAAEILFMWFLEPLRRRLGAYRLLILGAAGGVVRWTAMAAAPPLILLWPLQTLHALSFAATFLAGLQIIEELAPPESASAAQTLSSAVSGGVLIGLATVLSGTLYDRYGAGGYLAMAALAALGLWGALRLSRAVTGVTRVTAA